MNLRDALLALTIGTLGGTAVGLTGCMTPDDSHTKHVLQSAGYSKIQIGEYAWFGCSEDDNERVKFHAVGPTGVPVNGVVCCQWSLIEGASKACTIRLD